MPYGTKYVNSIAYKVKIYKAANVIYKKNRVLKMAVRVTLWRL